MKFKKGRLFFLSVATATITPAIVASCGIIVNNNKKDINKKTDDNIKNKNPDGTITPSKKEDPTKDNVGKKDNDPVINKETKNTFLREKSQHFIAADQKINYVAFGDSIAAGFDGTLDKDYKGQKLENGVIDGASYPAFLARALNVNNRIDSFTNYSKTGSRVEDWNRILFDKANPLSTKDKIDFFGNDYDNVIQKFKNDFQKANLITFSLGANDFIELLIQYIYDGGIVNDLFNSKDFNLDLNVVFDRLKKPIEKIIEYVETGLTKFIEKLKLLAPNANINVISYPLPLLKLEETINKLIQDNSKLKSFSIFKEFDTRINEVFKEVSEKTGVNYINSFNYDYWENHKDKLTSLFFDIHPDIFGYKKMALDIYLKITNNFYNKEQFDKVGNYDFSDKFIKDDFKTTKYQIGVDNYKPTVISKFGDSTEKYLDTNSDYEKSIIKKANFENYGKKIKGILVKWIDTVYPLFLRLSKFDFYKQIDKDHKIYDFLTTIPHENPIGDYGKFFVTNFHLMYLSILQGDFLDKFLAALQENLTKIEAKNPNKPFTTSQITDALLDSIKNQDVIKALLESLIKGPFADHFFGLINAISKALKDNNSPEAKQLKKLFGF